MAESAQSVPTTGSDGFKENLDGATSVDWKVCLAVNHIP
jgi:hypothetical protein